MKLIAIISAMLILTGCSIPISTRTQEMNSLIGRGDKSLIINKFGPPDKQVAITHSTDIWEYRLDEQKFTSSTGYRFSMFDRMRLTFINGVLTSWSVEDVVE